MNNKAKIQPRILKGFRDYLPEMMMPREQLIETARRVYRSYGFSPIDTPSLEYLEILTGKGGEETDKQLYQFEDSGGRAVGMRFDLTVPLARFAAQHIQQLGTPFKRYHIGTVWRGEKPHAGRFREFMQCDFDTIGTRSVASDIETALVIHDLMVAIGFDAFTIRVNNRQILRGVLQRQGLEAKAVPVLRALDKIAKIGPEKVAKEMEEVAGLSPNQAAEVLRLAEIRGGHADVLAALDPLVAGTEIGQEGLQRLGEFTEGVTASGVPADRIVLDVAIARGLDYYTGMIFETFLDKLPGIGSVCSGGRYDNLAELYTTQQLPGIGASLGLDRLLAAMQEMGMVEPTRTPADVLVCFFDRDRLADYLRIAASLRRAGVAVELYPEPIKLGQQLKYADRRGFRVAVIAGSQEFEAGTCQVKDLASGDKQDLPLESLTGAIVERLGG